MVANFHLRRVPVAGIYSDFKKSMIAILLNNKFQLLKLLYEETVPPDETILGLLSEDDSDSILQFPEALKAVHGNILVVVVDDVFGEAMD